jgi:AraC-like DNA-binding protein
LADGISLAEVAAQCRLSVGHFTRAFRRSTGTSPHRWIISRRLDRAVAMLANSTLGLADVALMCGFSDQSHFTRLFARNLGMTPGTWRRTNSLDPSST